MRNHKSNAYTALRVEQSATGDEIRAAYRALVKIYHSDLKPGDKVHEERFKRINRAFEILKDPKKRVRYDAKLSPLALSRILLTRPRRTYYAIWITAAVTTVCGISFVIYLNATKPLDNVMRPEQSLRESAVSDSPPRTEKTTTRFSFPEKSPLSSVLEPPPSTLSLTHFGLQTTQPPVLPSQPTALAAPVPAQTKVQRPSSKPKRVGYTQTAPASSKPNLLTTSPPKIVKQTTGEVAATPEVKVKASDQSHVSEVLSGGF